MDSTDVAEEIVVEARDADVTDPHARSTLGESDLEQARGQDLAEAISEVPGVTVSRGSADTSKPIIRGQVERRLLVLFDDVRHESQKWGADHATEIDPFSAGSIAVVKGAAGVRYGPDAIGGVILVEPPPFRTEPGAEGRVELAGVSNGRRGIGAGRLDVAPVGVPGFVLRVEGAAARGASLETPDYVLGNTATDQRDAGIAVRWQRDLTQLTFAWHRYDLTAGVCYCLSTGTVDDFLSQIDAAQPIGADAWEVTYTIERPYQAVTHDRTLARAVVPVGSIGLLRATWAFQDNERREYEQVRDEATAGPQYDFSLTTHTGDMELAHAPIGLSFGSLDGVIGVSGTYQENVYRGLPLIPNYRSLSGGAFWVETMSLGPVDVEGGLRVDHQGRTSYLTHTSFASHLAKGTLDADDCEQTPDAAKCRLTFTAGSATVGALWHALKDRLDLKLDLSSANRFPNGDELYMNGAAPTAPVYAVGDPSLGVETTWGISPTAGVRFPGVTGEVSGYVNRIDDFVYFAPSIGEDGEPEFVVTIRGATPVFRYEAIDATYYGADGFLQVGPPDVATLTLGGAIVRARNRATGEWLLFVPADRANATVRVAPPAFGRGVGASWIEVRGDLVAEQTRVDPGADLAPPPEGYALLGAGAGASWRLRGGRELSVSLEGENLLNERYREYTSLLRYFADEPGREVRLRLGFQF